MAQRGFSGPTLGAWGFNRLQTAGLIELASKEPRAPRNQPNIWKAWYFADISVVALDLTVTTKIGAVTRAS